MRIACYQGPDHPDDVMAAIRSAAMGAAASGADLLVCPEMVATGYAIGVSAVRALAEPPGGPIEAQMAGIARDAGIALVAGWPEAEAGAVYNAAIALGPDGAPLARYRKTHLFGELDRAQFAPGAAPPPIFGLCGLRVGILICYDVEFPEMTRRLALAGADLIVVPTALMSPYEVVADILIPARAYENQVFVAYANRCDREADLSYCGRSCVAGPDGVARARAGASEATILADLDPGALRASRARNTHLSDRRPGLYAPLAFSEKT